MMESRTENDFLGALEVPADAYYGIHTLRASSNFPVSGLRVPPEMVHAMAQVKMACTRANVRAGLPTGAYLGATTAALS